MICRQKKIKYIPLIKSRSKKQIEFDIDSQDIIDQTQTTLDDKSSNLEIDTRILEQESQKITELSNLKQQPTSILSNRKHISCSRFKIKAVSNISQKPHNVQSSGLNKASSFQSLKPNKTVSYDTNIQIENEKSNNSQTTQRIEVRPLEDKVNENLQILEKQNQLVKTKLKETNNIDEYYKPKISVELEEAENFKTTTEVHIKGWKIETPMMEVLTECFPHIECLNTIKYKRSFENKI